MNDEKDPPDFARSAQRNQSSAQTPERLPATGHWPGSTLLFQQANLEIFWDDRGWLYVDWVGMQSMTNLREGCEQMMRFLQLKAVDSVLNDFSRMEGMWIREPEWLAREWFPTMIRAGLKRFACLQPPTGLSQLSAEETAKLAPGGLAQVFSTRDEAEAWLMWQASIAAKRKTHRLL